MDERFAARSAPREPLSMPWSPRCLLSLWSRWRCWCARVRRVCCSRLSRERPRTCFPPPALSTSHCIKALSLVRAERRAQATVEAALLLPSFLTVLLLALQPMCLLYTRAVMESAAAETARLMITTSTPEADGYRSFAQRRLAAVPDLDIFHAGGPLSWDIETVASSRGDAVRVSIEGAVSPLPVLGAFVGIWGERNASGDVVLRAEASYAGRPDWLEGDYASWISAWG